MKRWMAPLLLTLAVTQVSRAQETLHITVSAAKTGFENMPLCIPLSVPKALADLDEVAVEIVGKEMGRTVGQLTAPGIVTESVKPVREGTVRRDLHVILPPIEAGGSRELVVRLQKVPQQVVRFGWYDKKGFPELVLTRSGSYTPYLRYMNAPYDTSTANARDKSYKVFHHLYDPTGKRFITNGGFADEGITDPKKLLYPHHRGIMYGFNKCSYGPDLKKKADTWHCTGNAHVAHEKILSTEAGPVLGRHRVLLGWFGEKGNDRFAEEERELTVYQVKGGTLVEFASRLKTTDGKIRVDGDPQHAGFQFRAANEVAEKTKKQTYYLHPDGKGELGKERNWDPKTKQGPVDLPWYCMSFVLDNQRYTVCYLNHPSNPKESRFSERDYARIGGYFERDITAEQPLVVNYRLWLQNGEMTPEQATALRTAFAAPPKTVVK